MEYMSPNPHQQGDEMTLKQLILNIQDWGRYLLKKWKIILFFGILGGAAGLTFAYFQKTQYVAEITFILEEGSSGPFGAYAGIANQIGIDLGGVSSSSGLYTEENILAFLKSRLMIEKTLLSPIFIDSNKISLADAYVNIYKLREKWREKEHLKNINFPIYPDRRNFSLIQDSLLNVIHENITKRNLTVGKLDKKLSFISVKCTSPDEIFSKTFTEHLVREATDFYVQTKTKRSKVTVDKLQEKADSVELLLNRKTYSVAATQDMNLNPARSLAGVAMETGTRDKMVLQTIYAEVLKNLEISKMAMAQETPIIQTIDTPILPLEKEKLSKFKSLIIGGFIGGLLIVMILLFRKLYDKIMK